MIDPEEIRSAAAELLPTLLPVIEQVGQEPEIGFQEHNAARLQSRFLQENGFAVQQGIGRLATAYKAVFTVGNEPGCQIAVLTEFDALPPPLGHACGHQLIMGAGLLSALILKKLMQKYQINGSINVFGCPGEELLGGKIFMLEDGAFENMEIALLSHPFFCNGVTRNILAVSHYNVEFFGRSAHASTAPEQGINALDAMTIFMNGINAWRQQLPSSARVHGIITDGGTVANVIPDHTSGIFYVRSDNNDYQKIMEARFDDIARGAALIAGCEYKLEYGSAAYSAGKPNAILAAEAEKIMTACGIDYPDSIPQPFSTDFANVCDALPGVNIYFAVTGGKPLALHSEAFRQAAAAPEARPGMVGAATVMAKLALNYLQDESLRSQVVLSS